MNKQRANFIIYNYYMYEARIYVCFALVSDASF